MEEERERSRSAAAGRWEGAGGRLRGGGRGARGGLSSAERAAGGEGGGLVEIEDGW